MTLEEHMAEAERSACLTWVPLMVKMAYECNQLGREAEAELHVATAIKNLMVGSHAGRRGR